MRLKASREKALKESPLDCMLRETEKVYREVLISLYLGSPR